MKPKSYITENFHSNPKVPIDKDLVHPHKSPYIIVLLITGQMNLAVELIP